MIPYGRQDISQSDIDAVTKVLSSDYLTQGPVIGKFESALATNVGANCAVAVNSATSALHLACLALGLRKGDYLWTTPITFVASANCGLYCGAKVDFVDIDINSYNMSVTSLEEKLKTASVEGRLPKVLVVVHLGGNSCDMEAIYKLATHYGVKIIEDASHAIGGTYNSLPVGSCEYSDMTIFSFHPVKIVTTGEGGAVVTNDQQLYERVLLLRSHGITRDPSKMTEKSHGEWYYQQIDLGYNYRMTEIQAALGLSQLDRLSDFIAHRTLLARRYEKLLAECPLTLQVPQNNVLSAYHLYIVRLKLSKGRRSHKEVFEYLRDKGIGVNLHYIPVHIQPYFKQLGFSPNQFPNAMEYYQTAISIPIFHSMTFEQQDEVVSTISEALGV